MASTLKFLDRIKDLDKLKDVDAGCKVSFNFAWMDDSVNYEDKFGVKKNVFCGLFLKKPDIPGKCFCTMCNCTVNYALRGKIAWTQHLKTSKH